MTNRNSRGHLHLTVSGEIIGLFKDGLFIIIIIIITTIISPITITITSITTTITYIS